jgi:hypothetical protein
MENLFSDYSYLFRTEGMIKFSLISSDNRYASEFITTCNVCIIIAISDNSTIAACKCD